SRPLAAEERLGFHLVVTRRGHHTVILMTDTGAAWMIRGLVTRIIGLSARTWGALAVVGVVIAFSLSSTLVKRAESPGALVAFWRLTIVSVVWNAYLWSTGRRVTARDV